MVDNLAYESGTAFFRENIENIWRRHNGDAYLIARMYGISPSSVYRILREYCKDNNKNYQAYLRYPHKPHVMRNGKIIRVKNVKPRDVSAKRVKFKVKQKPERIPQVFIVDEEIEYIAELRTCRSDVVEGADLMLVFVEDMMKERKE